MTEAQTIVENIPIVTQSKQLLNNLFGRYNSADSSAPNFSFYWDSNKDGTTEKYTALDLSFLDQPLTNTNLEDKRRFSTPLTVRSFIHLLIIFLSYSLFFIRLIKMVPTLLGSFGEATYKKIENQAEIGFNSGIPGNCVSVTNVIDTKSRRKK